MRLRNEILTGALLLTVPGFALADGPEMPAPGTAESASARTRLFFSARAPYLASSEGGFGIGASVALGVPLLTHLDLDLSAAVSSWRAGYVLSPMVGVRGFFGTSSVRPWLLARAGLNHVAFSDCCGPTPGGELGAGMDVAIESVTARFAVMTGVPLGVVTPELGLGIQF